ncbi:MAG: hypothetical protein PHR35_18515, partial [Kiritimatiellae bacterium]|nr:hypothetical protein [Kiritimatiellia bacterium]
MNTGANMPIRRKFMTTVASAALVAVLASVGAARSDDIPPIADESLYRSMVIQQVRMPPQLYTPEVKERLRKKKGNPLDLTALGGNAGIGERIAREIPPERWTELIPRHAAFTKSGVLDNHPRPVCPFCGGAYARPRMTVDELIASPFRAKTGCCGATLYEREEDMPQDYPVRPNHTEVVPHLDGTECSYRFFVPPGAEASDFGFDSNRAKWFCSAAEVWWARAFLLHTGSPQSVLKGLATRAFLADDERAYRALAAIYARLAEVYPGWPLTDFSKVANGLARSGDMKGYLTQAEYRATPVPSDYAKPKWFHARYHNLDKMNMASGWQDGVMAQQADLVDIFDLIRDHPAVLAYSRERYGDEREWERRVRKGVVDEAHFIAQCSPTLLRGGNTMMGWIKGGLKLGTVVRDEYFIRTAAVMIQGVLQNQFWGDGLSVEGAFNYGGMMQGAIDIIPVLRDEFGVDFSRTFPYAARIA